MRVTTIDVLLLQFAMFILLPASVALGVNWLYGRYERRRKLTAAKAAVPQPGEHKHDPVILSLQYPDGFNTFVLLGCSCGAQCTRYARHLPGHWTREELIGAKPPDGELNALRRMVGFNPADPRSPGQAP